MKYTVETKAVVGDHVEVANYRKSEETWEPGIVERVWAMLYWDGRSHVSYDVVLDRRNAMGDCMRMHVGDTGIRHE